MSKKVKTTKLTHVHLVQNHNLKDYPYTLTLVYEVTHDNGSVDQYRYENVPLPIWETNLPSYNVETFGLCGGIHSISFGTGKILCSNENPVVTEIKNIKKPNSKKMTIEEIEKLLGYPVKIVKEK